MQMGVRWPTTCLRRAALSTMPALFVPGWGIMGASFETHTTMPVLIVAHSRHSVSLLTPLSASGCAEREGAGMCSVPKNPVLWVRSHQTTHSSMRREHDGDNPHLVESRGQRTLTVPPS